MPLIHLFFFSDTAPTEIYTLTLHDALPISGDRGRGGPRVRREQEGQRPQAARGRGHARAAAGGRRHRRQRGRRGDRKSTRLNSSHPSISYAVFCLKKKRRTSKYR